MRDYRSQINGSELQDIEKEQQKQKKTDFSCKYRWVRTI